MSVKEEEGQNPSCSSASWHAAHHKNHRVSSCFPPQTSPKAPGVSTDPTLVLCEGTAPSSRHQQELQSSQRHPCSVNTKYPWRICSSSPPSECWAAQREQVKLHLGQVLAEPPIETPPLPVQAAKGARGSRSCWQSSVPTPSFPQEHSQGAWMCHQESQYLVSNINSPSSGKATSPGTWGHPALPATPQAAAAVPPVTSKGMERTIPGWNSGAGITHRV